ncbi:MAG: hypothetical protein GW823_05865 [Bacteroidetes bacterium]|nr:hypothetical protein [Bacteroidota bacterium]
MSKLFDLLLSFTLIYSIIKLIKLYLRVKKAEYFFYILGLFGYFGMILSSYLDYFLEQYSNYIFDHQLMVEWSNISGVAFLLSGLAFLIYNSKPPFARFPKLLCFIPLMIIPAYYFSLSTLALKEWILMIYETGAFLVALLMFSALIRKSWNYTIILMALLLILAGYILLHTDTQTVTSAEWIWKSFIISGMFILIHGFYKIEQKDEDSYSNT